jgi:uncharacterized SAM-binding protein YcdF (DUF218 family)
MATKFLLFPRRFSRTFARPLIRALVLLAFLAIAGIAAWHNRTLLLRVAVDLWAVSDPVGPADAVAVFGGGGETRAPAAAEYYRRGLVKKVLVSNIDIDEVAPGVFHSETDYNRSVLVKLGVPPEAIELFGADLSSTYEEAVALRDWVIRNHVRSIIVPTEFFSSRRVRWIVNHELAYTWVRVAVPALDYPTFARDAWWTNEFGVTMFRTEVIKYIYYRLRY